MNFKLLFILIAFVLAVCAASPEATEEDRENGTNKQRILWFLNK